VFFLAVNGGNILKNFRKINHEDSLELHSTRGMICWKISKKNNDHDDTVEDEPYENEGTHNKCSRNCNSIMRRI
jgi:hypothetical protein